MNNKLTLKQYLNKHRMSQTRFCKLVGVPRPSVCWYLQGRVGFGEKVIQRILDKTEGMDFDSLYFPTDIPKLYKRRLSRPQFCIALPENHERKENENNSN